MGQLPAEELDLTAGSMVWMLRAGRAGVYAPVFVERSLAMVGWGQTGDVSEMSREELEKAVAESFPDATGTSGARRSTRFIAWRTR
jgi:predicted Mrr-cat superfamily restriction endonuclease